MSWATPRRDKSESSVDLRKAEIFINNRRGEESVLAPLKNSKEIQGEADALHQFEAMEFYRLV